MINKKQKRFTLIELIIVIVVIGILASMALPKFMGVRRNANVAAMERDLDTLEKAVQLYVTNTNDGSYPFKDLNGDNIINEEDLYYKTNPTPQTLKDSLLKGNGDDGSKIYQLDKDKLEPYIQKLKYNDTEYLYSPNSEIAIDPIGRVDGDDNIHHIIGESVKNFDSSNGDNPNEGGDSNNSQKLTISFNISFDNITTDTEIDWNSVIKLEKNETKSILRSSEEDVVEYLWTLDNKEYNNTNDLPTKLEKGNHTVKVKARIDNSAWSNEISQTFDVTEIITEYEFTKSLGWDKNDKFSKVIKTSDGGFIAFGETYSTTGPIQNKGENDILVVKFDKNGNAQWTKNIGGDKYEYIYGVTETKDGGYIIAADTQSTDLGYSVKGYKDGLLIKIDNKGNTQWVNGFGGSGEDRFQTAIETKNGDIVAVGYIKSTDSGLESKGLYDAIIARYDKNGKQLWVKNWGGTLIDQFLTVVEDTDGGLIASGKSQSTDAGYTNKGGYDGVFVKFNENGEYQWVKSFGGSGSDTLSAVKSNDGGFIAYGFSDSTNLGFTNKGSSDAIIVKFDKDFNKQWIKNVGGSGSDSFGSIVETIEGDIVGVGSSSSTNAGFVSKGSSDALVARFDKNGLQKEVKAFGGSGSDSFNGVITTNDNGFIAVGETRSTDLFPDLIGANGFVVKFH